MYLVFHRMQRHVHACHCAHFARPQATRVNHMFGMNGAFVRDHVPCAIRPLIGFTHHAVGFNCCSAHAGRFGIGMGGSRWIKVPIQRIVQTADNALHIGDRGDFFDFFGSDDLGFKPHVAVLGPFSEQHVHALLVIGQCHAAHVVQATGHACQLFQFFVQADCVAL